MSVYIEAVIIGNFAATALLTTLLCKVRRREIKMSRILFAALIGSGWATAYPLLSTALRCVVKVILCPLIAVLAVETQGADMRHKAGDIAVNSAALAALAFAFGGTVTGLAFVFGVDRRYGADVWIALLAAAALTICVGAIVKVKRGKGICKTEVGESGRKFRVNALQDSGNLLVDDISGLPVVIISRRLSRMMLRREPERFIEVNTVGGRDVLPLYDLEHIKVGKKTFRALCAVSDSPMNGFDVILQGSML